MNQRTLLLIATVLTGFLLVIGGGLAGRIFTKAPLAASAPPATVVAATVQVSAPTVAAELDPTVQTLIREREATYQQALADANAQLSEANSRIEQANQQIAAANTQIKVQEAARPTSKPVAIPRAAPPAAPIPAAPTTQPAAPAAQPAAAYAISVEQAQAIALAYAPGAQLQRPAELVRFQGTPAYEVALDRGTLYIDAQSGQVIYSGIVAPAAPQRGAGEGEHDDHEEEGDHHD
jgi:uncharacterized membrane protein YkoI